MVDNPAPLMARQPILDINLTVVGYELLCRPVPIDSSQWQIDYGDDATREVIIGAFNDIGIENITHGLPAYINFTHFWLHNPPRLPKKAIVAEVLEHLEVTEENLKALKALRSRGFTLALDDYAGNPALEPFFDYVHIIKLDLRMIGSLEALANIINRYRERDIIWLAEKVETQAEYEFCKNAGCTLFQGYFFSQPAIVYGNRLPDNQASIMLLLKELNKSSINLDEITNVLVSDPQLSFKLIKIVNSVAYGIPRPVTSISQAILIVGLRQLRSWANLIALGKLNKKPHVLREHALTRAILCQNLSSLWLSLDADTAFTIGLFSLLPAFLDTNMENICIQLHLSDEFTDALLHNKGHYGMLLIICEALEKGEWEKINWKAFAKQKISPGHIEKLYLDAIKSAHKLITHIG